MVRDPAALTDLIVGAGACRRPPSLWRELVAYDVTLPRMRVLTGGEALSAPLAASLCRIGEVTNLYGPTESTIYSTASLVVEGTVPTIGRPISNAQVYVLDADLRPVPAGVIADLYIAGDGITRGYLGQPGRTAERFVANPFGPPGSTMYRTGDLARSTAAGEVDYVGRDDS